jgi:hypothetical protein
LNQATLPHDLKDIPRVPIFIESIDREEPKELSGSIQFAFAGITIGDAQTWSATILPPVQWAPEGITVQYVQPMGLSETTSSRAAVAIRESLRSENLISTVASVPSFAAAREWPSGAPTDAIVVRIGAKPNHFWQNKRFREQGLPEIFVPSGCTSDEIFK